MPQSSAALPGGQSKEGVWQLLSSLSDIFGGKQWEVWVMESTVNSNLKACSNFFPFATTIKILLQISTTSRSLAYPGGLGWPWSTVCPGILEPPTLTALGPGRLSVVRLVKCPIVSVPVLFQTYFWRLPMRITPQAWREKKYRCLRSYLRDKKRKKNH